MISQYPYLPIRESYRLFGAPTRDIAQVQSLLQEYFGRPVTLLNAARTGIYLALAAKRYTKTVEIMVPPYSSKCVLDTIAERTIPTLHVSPHTKAILLVHQYGYPQRMDIVGKIAREKGLFIIEDSAFSFDTRYKGEIVGSWGDVSIFNFSKTFKTVMGGCFLTEDGDIVDFAERYMKEQDRAPWRFISNLSLVTTVFEYGTRPESASHTLANHFLSVFYSQYKYFPNPNKRVCHLFPNSATLFRTQLEARRNNLRVFRECFGGTENYPDELEQDSDVVPFIAPYFGEKANLERIAHALKKHDITTTVHHFDVHRNMFDPSYMPMLPIPVHQGISENMMGHICKTISDAAS